MRHQATGSNYHYTTYQDVLQGKRRNESTRSISRWQRVITTSDSEWLTKESFSQNCTFTVKNYLHEQFLILLCMRGADKVKYFIIELEKMQRILLLVWHLELQKKRKCMLRFSGKMAVILLPSCFKNTTWIKKTIKGYVMWQPHS